MIKLGYGLMEQIDNIVFHYFVLLMVPETLEQIILITILRMLNYTAVNWWERSAVSKKYNNDVELNGCYCRSAEGGVASYRFAYNQFWEAPYTMFYGGGMLVV